MAEREVLPDGVNIVARDGEHFGDVLPLPEPDDTEPDQTDPFDETGEPEDITQPTIETESRSKTFLSTVSLLESGVQRSNDGGYRHLKVLVNGAEKPMVHFLAGRDFAELELTKAERQEILDRFLAINKIHENQYTTVGERALHSASDDRKPWQGVDSGKRAGGDY